MIAKAKFSNLYLFGFFPLALLQNFTGNSNQNGVKRNVFDEVWAQYIRIEPQAWHGEIALRFELLGCTTERRIRRELHCHLTLIPLGYFEDMSPLGGGGGGLFWPPPPRSRQLMDRLT